MLAFIACLLATQVPVDQPPRLRTILPNGAAILVEAAPKAKGLSIELFISSRGTEETPITNGLRHLLEHLVALGPKGDLDRRLEAAGGFLVAQTSRDAMEFRLNLPNGKLDFGLKCVEELTHMPEVTPETIKHEALILEQEVALRDDSAKFSSAAWTLAFGDKGLDPIGNLDVIRNATPAMLDSVHKIMFSGPNLVIAVAGDVDLDAATIACSSLLANAAKRDVVEFNRGAGVGGNTTVEAAGIAYSVPVPSFKMPETAARLAAALAIASEADHCFVIYTPSANSGMVTLGRTENKAELETIVRKANANDLFARGKILAKAWVNRNLDSPEHVAAFRGLLLVNAIDLKPDSMLENINAMTHADFASAIESYRTNAVMVQGR